MEPGGPARGSRKKKKREKIRKKESEDNNKWLGFYELIPRVAAPLRDEEKRNKERKGD